MGNMGVVGGRHWRRKSRRKGGGTGESKWRERKRKEAIKDQLNADIGRGTQIFSTRRISNQTNQKVHSQIFGQSKHIEFSEMMICFNEDSSETQHCIN